MLLRANVAVNLDVRISAVPLNGCLIARILGGRCPGTRICPVSSAMSPSGVGWVPAHIRLQERLKPLVLGILGVVGLASTPLSQATYLKPTGGGPQSWESSGVAPPRGALSTVHPWGGKGRSGWRPSRGSTGLCHEHSDNVGVRNTEYVLSTNHMPGLLQELGVHFSGRMLTATQGDLLTIIIPFGR